MIRVPRIVIVSCLVLLISAAAGAAKWPEIPKSDWAVNEVAGSPNAPAAILLREGLVHFSDKTPSSYIEVYTRIKILTAEGTAYGTVSLFSSDYLRTKEIEGRTHLPDGTVVELPPDATFEKVFSDYYSTTIASAALPKVVPGAIIEYRYTTYFDYIAYTRPWFFQAEIPTLLSRVTYELPQTVRFHPIEISTLRTVKMNRQVENGPHGNAVQYTMENLPAVPDEPFSFPFADLSSRVTMLPGIDYSIGGGLPSLGRGLPLFETWDSVVALAVGNSSYGYTKFRGNDGDAKKKARDLARGAGSPTESANAIYRWVRDQVDTEPYVGIWVGERTADDIVKNGTGDAIEKALLLENMLQHAKIDAAIGWTNPRSNGRINVDVPNPGQFATILVIADIGRKRYFLDPTDNRLAFGLVAPGVRGAPCLVITKRKHEWITLPPLEPSESTRTATIDLAVGDNGVMTGSGLLALTGYSAWRRLHWENTAEDTEDAWGGWIETAFPGYDVADVGVEEDVEATEITVTWKMAQRAEETLSDEAIIKVAEPLAVTSNPFVLEPSRRLTPVQLAYSDIDRVVLTVSWPHDWVVDDLPRLATESSSAGMLATKASIDEDARTATFERVLEIDHAEFMGREPYAGLRNLYVAAVTNDSEELVLTAE